MRGSLDKFTKKKELGPERPSDTFSTPSNARNLSLYIIFLSYLCCRGPENSVGARRYIIFVDSHLKIPTRSPSQIPIQRPLRSWRKSQNPGSSLWCFHDPRGHSDLVCCFFCKLLCHVEVLESTSPPLQGVRPPQRPEDIRF